MLNVLKQNKTCLYRQKIYNFKIFLILKTWFFGVKFEFLFDSLRRLTYTKTIKVINFILNAFNNHSF